MLYIGPNIQDHRFHVTIGKEEKKLCSHLPDGTIPKTHPLSQRKLIHFPVKRKMLMIYLFRVYTWHCIASIAHLLSYDTKPTGVYTYWIPSNTLKKGVCFVHQCSGIILSSTVLSTNKSWWYYWQLDDTKLPESIRSLSEFSLLSKPHLKTQ